MSTKRGRTADTTEVEAKTVADQAEYFHHKIANFVKHVDTCNSGLSDDELADLTALLIRRCKADVPLSRLTNLFDDTLSCYTKGSNAGLTHEQMMAGFDQTFRELGKRGRKDDTTDDTTEVAKKAKTAVARAEKAAEASMKKAVARADQAAEEAAKKAAIPVD